MIALTGIGYDIHRFAEVPRPLMLGGVHIPSSRGLDGHSDADVLCHAIADALLGAAGLPDIGYWFPPGDPSCKDIPSLDIVAKAVSLIRERGGRIVNVDSSLIAESPRISPYLGQMKGALGAALGISPVRVGIKATTNEQLGALGRREGIAAFAVAAILMPEDLTMP
nr:2-C-methyl-D-erythritol 2,4-cyclodiphosphate synthase [Akkermansia muciniphila]